MKFLDVIKHGCQESTQKNDNSIKHYISQQTISRIMTFAGHDVFRIALTSPLSYINLDMSMSIDMSSGIAGRYIVYDCWFAYK